jgi:hypothetical protein
VMKITCVLEKLSLLYSATCYTLPAGKAGRGTWDGQDTRDARRARSPQSSSADTPARSLFRRERRKTCFRVY